MFTLNDPVAVVMMIWAGIGLATGIAFLFYGMDKVDEAAEGAYAVRPLLLPGMILIWPLVLWRWYQLSRGER